MEEFRRTLRMLKKMRQEEGLTKLEDNMLFDGAVRIHNARMINKTQKSSQESPMTQKQKNLLENLEYKGPMNLTKGEATKVIQTYIAQRKNRTAAP